MKKTELEELLVAAVKQRDEWCLMWAQLVMQPWAINKEMKTQAKVLLAVMAPPGEDDVQH